MPSKEGYLNENFRYFHLRDTAGAERDYHYHEFDKIVILLSGRVDYAVESGHYSLNPGDVLLVQHHAIHKAIIDLSEPYERIIIYLDGAHFARVMPEYRLTDCFALSDAGNEHLYSPDEHLKEQILAALRDYESVPEDFPGADAMRELKVCSLLVLINSLVSSGKTAPVSRYNDKIEKTLSYISENLNRPLSVEELAENAFLSKYHFMRVFKEATGSTVHAYVRQRRLLFASRLIREGTPALRAAAMSGFEDYSTFQRAFKAVFQVSPEELKKQSPG